MTDVTSRLKTRLCDTIARTAMRLEDVTAATTEDNIIESLTEIHALMYELLGAISALPDVDITVPKDFN